MSVAVCRVDRSSETGDLVVCTCGFTMGPFMTPGNARDSARAHREVHNAEAKLVRQRERIAAKRRGAA